MRKSVALIISLVVLVGACLVAFFGTIPANISPTVYIETIELLDMYGQPLETSVNGQKLLRLDFVPDLRDDENDTDYMQYFFTVNLNEGLEPPTHESVLYIMDIQNDPVDDMPLMAPANGDYSSGAFLIKERKNIQNVSDYFLFRTITVQSNDGGNPVTDRCLLLINYGYPGQEEGEG